MPKDNLPSKRETGNLKEFEIGPVGNIWGMIPPLSLTKNMREAILESQGQALIMEGMFPQ